MLWVLGVLNTLNLVSANPMISREQRKVVSEERMTRQVHRMYSDSIMDLKLWYANDLQFPCTSNRTIKKTVYWYYNESSKEADATRKGSGFRIGFPNVNHSGIYDCCLLPELNVTKYSDCYRTHLTVTEGIRLMEVDVRKRNDTEKIIKTLPTNYDMYFWVFTGASNLVHCEFDTSSLRSKRIVSQSNASNVNVSYADSPFGWMYSNLVIYNTSRENSGIYTCLNENNDTNSFELIFGLDYEDNASPGFDFYTKLLLVLGLSYVFWSI